MARVQLDVKVVPGARRDAVAGWLGDALEVRVSAPPERGKANAAVVRLIAELLDVPASDVSVASGQTSPRKRLTIEGLDSAELRARIEAALR
ncbi:MAG: DUF167 domain-containing protein [Actinomycetota bacterium]|nr:DUF167 domain-containing protein [Actinomycetota bacterium]